MKKYDVVIVGAGPAGLFCAYELIENNKISAITNNNETFNINSLNVTLSGFDNNNISELPYDFYGGQAILLNNKIHILGSGYRLNFNKYLYTFSNNQYNKLNDLPYEFYEGCSIVYNDEIHIMGSTDANNRKSHYIRQRRNTYS